MTNETIQNIRRELRRFMNGVVSDTMRRNGILYKLNFGVSLPQLKEISSHYTPDKELAEALWKEDTRELRLLAFSLYPKDQFSIETARSWVTGIKYPEEAEQFTLRLLQYLPFAQELACEWVKENNVYTAATGFLLFSRLCTKGETLSAVASTTLLENADKTLSEGLSYQQRCALNALKRYGRQSPHQAEETLLFIENYPTSGIPEKEEFFNDLKFDFEYYL